MVDLLIEGVRRIGKSTLVRHFGEREYKSVVVIDFMKPNRNVVSAIRQHPDDLDRIFAEISFAYKVRLYERDALIVFDEVQRCPKARELIKALVADCRCDYIETGSLISIKNNVKNITIPSGEEAIGWARRTSCTQRTILSRIALSTSRSTWHHCCDGFPYS